MSTTDEVEQTEQLPPARVRRRPPQVARDHVDRFWSGLSTLGLIFGLVFFCFSMTPSLLPRPWYLQAIASGLCVVLGYGGGVLTSWTLRKLGFKAWSDRTRLILRRVLTVAAIVLIPLFGFLGARWQAEVRELVQVTESDGGYYIFVLLIAFLIARLLLGAVRSFRRLVRWFGRWASRWVPLPFAKLAATLVLLSVLITLVNDTLVPRLLSAANQSFSISDTGTPAFVERPTSTHRSGAPGSLVRWEDLGREGRTFVASGPSVQELAEFTGGEVLEPIRAYAGADSAPSLRAQADLVVEELNRTGAFDRSVLVVATTTGRGWINEAAATSVEYLWAGDTAIAGMQYSYFPSPVAFVLDTGTPPRAGEVLFDAVRDEWLQRPVDDRPLLLVAGESLGSYGSQGAFGSLDDVLAKTDGAVWSGTPRFTELWQEVTADRDPGSPEQVPVLDDCAQVCFADSPADLPTDHHPQVVYLQHESDPVVWWSTDLLFSRPDWLAEPAGPDRSSAITWFPLATFWQVSMDMLFSSSMPDGHGHHYGLELVDAWAAVAPPPGWTAEDTEALRAHLAD